MEIAVSASVVKKCPTCKYYRKQDYQCSNPRFRGAKALDSYCIAHDYKYWVEKSKRGNNNAKNFKI